MSASTPTSPVSSLPVDRVERFMEQCGREPAHVTRCRLEPILGRYGITRVANITGLDRLGIPVWMAIRPNAQSLSVSQGKGLAPDAAWVSAVMESIELWHAEAAELPLVLASRSELTARCRVLDIERVGHHRATLLGAAQRILWTEAIDILTGETLYVPFALVHVNSVSPFPPGDEFFPVTSNGLASGSTHDEAVVHALCEIIERDAVSRWRMSQRNARREQWLDLGSVEDDVVRWLLDRCAEAQFDVLACTAGSPTGVPVIVCVLLDRLESDETLRGAAMGFGCHLRRDVAFVRALTEAVQSRLTLIAGSRDDLDRSDYEAHRRHRDGVGEYRQLIGVRHPRDYRAVPDFRDFSPEAYPDVLLDRLRRCAVDEVALVTMTRAEGPAVVRIVVPGLLGPDHAH